MPRRMHQDYNKCENARYQVHAHWKHQGGEGSDKARDRGRDRDKRNMQKDVKCNAHIEDETQHEEKWTKELKHTESIHTDAYQQHN